jgi:subtilisin-like proprotein convertase family protein
MRSLSILFCLAFVLGLTTAGIAQQTFTNGAAIPIGDGSAQTSGLGNPYPSTITVAGVAGTVTDVNVRINSLTHTFPADVGLMLVAPNGAFMVLQTDAGGGADISNVTYTLDDQAGGLIPDAGPITATSYKPTSINDDDFFPIAGGTPPPADCQPSGSGECPQAAPAGTTTLNSKFGGINPNGTWRLYVIDCCADDLGTINGGWSLIITTTGNGGTNAIAPVDFNGDHRTDWVVVRNTGGGTAGQITWYVATTTGSINIQPWGIATDFFVPADYDGGGASDYAIWRPGAQGRFYILHSENFTIRIDDFGTTGDDPTVVGDYNGDRAADVAVFRRSPTAGTPATWFYRPGASAGFVSVQFGQSNGNTCGAGSDSCGDFPAPGDYDGDGKNDFVIQRNNGSGQGIFFKLLTTNVFTSEVFGNATDAVVPGDYDGDGKTDLATVRAEGTGLVWRYEPSGTAGSTVVSENWGAAATDFPTQGDYNGDGRTDPAIWRATTGQFFVITSGNRNIFIQNWGAPDDYPVANFNTH